MKTLITLFLFIFNLSSFAQTSGFFEYKITSSKGPTGTLKAYYSAPGSRMEMQMIIPQLPGGGFTRVNIVRAETPSTIIQLDDKTKTYTTIQSKPASQSYGENRIVQMLGEEKVAGYNCTHASITEGTEIREFWLTTEIIDYEKYNNASGGGNKYMGTGEDYAALSKNGATGFVVKSFSKDPRGGDITMELQKFEKKDLDASLFNIPADYKIAGAGQSTEGIDINKLQNMTPAERDKYLEEMKKKYGK
ncbi:MAG: DUF4412 domain-containing protein [Bacteroidota bacterium]|nr:DUF4412 domain-containing protein [Bacteroidota bacterium]